MTETQKLSMVFIHIPKCGGTSVRQALIEAGYDSGRMGHDTMKTALKYRSDIKEFIVQVREPASRMVSAYNFMHRQLLDFPERLPWLEKYTNMELNNWIRLLLLDEDLPNLEKRKPLKEYAAFSIHKLNSAAPHEFAYHPRHSVRPQHCWVDHYMLPFKVFKIENGDIWNYFYKLGLNVYPLRLRASHATDKNPELKTVEDLTEESKYIIYHKYIKDYKLFDYEPII